jgi:hypothetical protein
VLLVAILAGLRMFQYLHVCTRAAITVTPYRSEAIHGMDDAGTLPMVPPRRWPAT